MKEKGYRTFVVSDDETVALHPAVEDEFCDGRFFLGSPDAALPAETLEETQFFRNFEELARFLAKLEDDAKCAKDENGGDAAPWFVWAHFSGWNERWDFPLELRERFQEDEDDPAPYSATLVPYWPLEEGAKSAKRGARVDENAVVEAALARAAAIPGPATPGSILYFDSPSFGLPPKSRSHFYTANSACIILSADGNPLFRFSNPIPEKMNPGENG